MLALDAETLPQDGVLDVPYNADDHAPPANYKNADALEKWHAGNAVKWREARVKECSLNPRLGRVCSIGYATRAGRFSDSSPHPDGERIILSNFWDRVRELQQVVTWNGKGFDFPFIIVRSAISGVLPAVEVPLYLQRYNNVPHFDVKHAVLGGDVRQKGEGLSEWSQAFGLPGKIAHGSEVYAMAQRGEWDTIGEYAADDAAKTYALAERLAPFFGVV